MTNHINTLNKVSEGWSESSSGMLVNSKNLDIIDVAPAIDEWFFISDFGNVEGYETRDDAVEGYIALVRANVQ